MAVDDLQVVLRVELDGRSLTVPCPRKALQTIRDLRRQLRKEL
jgi:hypothetical protein